jgi:spore germination protein KB
VADFYTGYIMPETPSMLIIILFGLVCAFAVKRGVGAIAKTSMVTTVLTVAIVILTMVLLIGDMDFTNFLPLFNNTPKTYLETTHTFSSISFCEIAAVLVLMPYLKNDKKLTSSMIWGTGIAAFIFLAIVVRDIAVLGASTGILVDNSYSAVKMINIGEFLTRIELFVALNYTGTLFIKISVLYFVTVSASRQLLNLNSDRSLLILLGSIAVVLAVIKMDSTIDHKMWGSKYAAFFELPFLWILPPLSLLIAKIRKKTTREIQPS